MEQVIPGRHAQTNSGTAEPSAIALATPPPQPKVEPRPAPVQQQRGKEALNDGFSDPERIARLKAIREQRNADTAREQLEKAQKKNAPAINAEKNYNGLQELLKSPLVQELQEQLRDLQKGKSELFVLFVGPAHDAGKRKERLALSAEGYVVVHSHGKNHEIYTAAKTWQPLQYADFLAQAKQSMDAAAVSIEDKRNWGAVAITSPARNKWLRRLKNAGKVLTYPLWKPAHLVERLFTAWYNWANYDVDGAKVLMGLTTVIGGLSGIGGSIALLMSGLLLPGIGIGVLAAQLIAGGIYYAARDENN